MFCSDIYTGDGMPLTYLGAKNIEGDKFSGYAIDIYKRAKDFADGLGLGESEFVEIQTNISIFVHTCIIPGVSAIGAIIKKDKGNVGLLRHNLRQIASKLEPEFK